MSGLWVIAFMICHGVGSGELSCRWERSPRPFPSYEACDAARLGGLATDFDVKISECIRADGKK